MSQYPQPCPSRIETSLPPRWKRSYGVHHPEDDDDENGPDPLIHTHHRGRESYSETPNHRDGNYRRIRHIPRPPRPLSPDARHRESYTSYPVETIHERVRNLKAARVAVPKGPVIMERVMLIGHDMPRAIRREYQKRDEEYVRPAYSAATYSDSDDENHVFYSFGDLLNKGGRRDSQLDGASISDIESTVAPDEVREDSANPTERGAAAYHVLESRYAGDGYEAGHHSVQLTAVLSERAAVSQSLFRWILQIQVAAIPGLSSNERKELQKMITGVKRDHTRTVQASDGKYARYLEPKLRHEPLMQDGKPVGSRAVTWVSLPYFSLEPYSGLLDAANRPKSLATPTLLQARYSRTTRVRDMEQAVCQQGGAPKGHCFHARIPLISSLFLIALLLTYGRITEEALREGIITKTVKPLHNPPDPMPSKTLSVRFLGAIMWSIPVHECETWFVRHPVVLSCDRITDAVPGAPFPTPDAAVPNESVSATLSPKPESQTPSHSAVSSKPSGESGHTSKPKTEFSCGIFAYSECFDNLDPSPAGPPAPAISSFPSSPRFPPSFKNAAVMQYFTAMERHIETKTTPEDRRAYRDIAKVPRADVYKSLVTKQQTPHSATTASHNKRDFEKRVAVFHSADIVFSFFFPPGVRVSTIRKFWGAVMAIINESDIVTKHSDRRIEHKLGLLQQELSIIDWTVELQRNILWKMMKTRESVSRSAEAEFLDEKSAVGPMYPWRDPRHPTMEAMAEAILQSSEPCGFSYMLLGEGLQELAVKRSELKLMGDLVAYLADTNRNKIDYTKDRQERAIYAFTIVTVIFLPLSAVASIFGMNSSDVRDMELGQWAYWATAVPVTAVVVFLGLLFTGELGTVRRWMGEVLGGGANRGGGGWWEGVGRREEVVRRVRGVRRRRR
ncbi:hypothetical protein B0I37DRAFT_392979 [Chaetomium sp. MPI-CAGE-AT-0009]|nr:hypothetical protein B0I37DRAFT_392979 [Chaetomium sp. MPI-CAGE-AT-0009]